MNSPISSSCAMQCQMQHARMMLFRPSLPAAAAGVKRRRRDTRRGGAGVAVARAGIVVSKVRVSFPPSNLESIQQLSLPTTASGSEAVHFQSAPGKKRKSARALTSSAQAARASHPLSSSPTATGRSLSVCLPCLGSRQSRPLRRCRHLATRKNNRRRPYVYRQVRMLRPYAFLP